MRTLRAVDLSFLTSAPRVFTFTGQVAAPRAAVFAAISDPSGWKSWFPAFTSGAYRGRPPHGVGSIREVRLTGGATFRETILAWDEGTRYTWRVDQAAPPIATALVEEWTCSGDGPTTVTWTFAVDPTVLFSVVLPLAPRVMGALFTRALRALEAQLG